MPIGPYMIHKVITAPADTTASAAARLMRERHVPSLVITDDDNRPVGIVSERDLVLAVLAEGRGGDDVMLGDIMSRDPITAGADEEVWDVVYRMRLRGLKRLPVVDPQGRLSGLIAADDLLAVLAAGINDLVAIGHRELANEQRRTR